MVNIDIQLFHGFNEQSPGTCFGHSTTPSFGCMLGSLVFRHYDKKILKFHDSGHE